MQPNHMKPDDKQKSQKQELKNKKNWLNKKCQAQKNRIRVLGEGKRGNRPL